MHKVVLFIKNVKIVKRWAPSPKPVGLRQLETMLPDRRVVTHVVT